MTVTDDGTDMSTEDQRATEGWVSCGDYPAPCNCDEGECPDRAGCAS